MFKNINRLSLVLVALLLLAACGQKTQTEPSGDTADKVSKTAKPVSGLEMAVMSGQRQIANIPRDQYRHPAQTLEFFGLKPNMTVVELYPGGGWYTEIIAPFLKQGGGHYIAAGFERDTDSEYLRKANAAFDERFVAHPESFGEIDVTVLSKDAPGIAPDESADLVLTFRNVHNWMEGGFAQKAFDDMFKALRPGGVMGVVEHRANPDSPQDETAASGYVREDYVIELAQNAGFVLEARSEINANPKDTKDHPYGVWTLPPTLRSSDYQGEADPDYDKEKYLAIGESDRMTLRFRKPINPDGALME